MSSVRRSKQDNREPNTGIPNVDDLIAALDSDDGLARQTAREALQDIGGPAVRPLLKALGDPNENVRWEAAKALGEIKDPAAAPALVKALEDENSGVRWLAAEGLIGLRRRALPPLLRALAEQSGSIWLRRGAHHVLHDLAGKGLGDELAGVLAALEDVAPAAELPPAAWAALEQLTGTRRRWKRSVAEQARRPQ